jgi:dTDP-L-rhamnose 4-epimerase
MERFGAEIQAVISGQFRLGDIRHGYADITAIHKQLEFAPAISLELGLDRFIAWVKQQPAEPDRLDAATQELISRGLMAEHVEIKAPSA